MPNTIFNIRIWKIFTTALEIALSKSQWNIFGEASIPLLYLLEFFFISSNNVSYVVCVLLFNKEKEVV